MSSSGNSSLKITTSAPSALTFVPNSSTLTSYRINASYEFLISGTTQYSSFSAYNDINAIGFTRNSASVRANILQDTQTTPVNFVYLYSAGVWSVNYNVIFSSEPGIYPNVWDVKVGLNVTNDWSVPPTEIEWASNGYATAAAPVGPNTPVADPEGSLSFSGSITQSFLAPSTVIGGIYTLVYIRSSTVSQVYCQCNMTITRVG